MHGHTVEEELFVVDGEGVNVEYFTSDDVNEGAKTEGAMNDVGKEKSNTRVIKLKIWILKVSKLKARRMGLAKSRMKLPERQLIKLKL